METVFYLLACSVSFAAGYLWRWYRDKRYINALLSITDDIKDQYGKYRKVYEQSLTQHKNWDNSTKGEKT